MNDIEHMFATADDFTPENIKQDIRLKGFHKAQYRITAWLKSERLKRLVYDIETPEMLDVKFTQAIRNIEARLLTWINRNVSNAHLKRKYINDIRQTCTNIGGQNG